MQFPIVWLLYLSLKIDLGQSISPGDAYLSIEIYLKKFHQYLIAYSFSLPFIHHYIGYRLVLLNHAVVVVVAGGISRRRRWLGHLLHRCGPRSGRPPPRLSRVLGRQPQFHDHQAWNYWWVLSTNLRKILSILIKYCSSLWFWTSALDWSSCVFLKVFFKAYDHTI